MTTDLFWDRKPRIADLLMLLAIIGLALASWACAENGQQLPTWKSCVGLGSGLILALAALTHHPVWESRLRLITATWMISAPWILGFAYVPLALAAYTASGGLVLATAAPRFARSRITVSVRP